MAEAHCVELTGASVPRWRFAIHVLERARPLLFDFERQRVRQIFLEQLRRSNHPPVTIFFDAREKFLEAESSFSCAAALGGARGHQLRKHSEDDEADSACQHQRRGGEERDSALERQYCDSAQHEGHQDGNPPRFSSCCIWTLDVVAGLHQLVVNGVRDFGHESVEPVSELRHLHLVRVCWRALAQRIQVTQLVRLETGPLRSILDYLEAVVCALSKSEEMELGELADVDVAAHGEVDEGGGDVADVSAVIDQRTELRRAGIRRWF